MSKKKLTHYTSVHIRTDVHHAISKGDSNVKVSIGTFYYNEPICQFYVPLSSATKIGNSTYIPSEIIKARAKHDFGITWDHNSATGG